MMGSHRGTGRTDRRPLRPTDGMVAGKEGLQSGKPGRTLQGQAFTYPPGNSSDQPEESPRGGKGRRSLRHLREA